MEQWQQVSNSLFQADTPSIASLSGIVNDLVQSYGVEPVELLSFSDSYIISNVNVNPHTDSFPGITFIKDWETGTAFDIKATWAWGLGENLAPETYETTSIKFNPYVELYGYFFSWFKMNLEYFHFDISFNFMPFDIKPFDFDLAIPNGQPWQFCAGISAKTKAVTMEINTNWGWPNCSWGFFEHYFGWRVHPSWGG